MIFHSVVSALFLGSQLISNVYAAAATGN